MSTLFGEMSANPVHAVHGLSHVWVLGGLALPAPQSIPAKLIIPIYKMCFSIVKLFNSASQINSKYYIPCLLATDPLDRIISSIVRGKCWYLLASWSKILLLLSWSSLTSGGSGQQKTRWWKQHDVQAWLTSPVLSFSQQRDQQSHWQEWCSTL